MLFVLGSCEQGKRLWWTVWNCFEHLAIYMQIPHRCLIIWHIFQLVFQRLIRFISFRAVFMEILDEIFYGLFQTTTLTVTQRRRGLKELCQVQAKNVILHGRRSPLGVFNSTLSTTNNATLKSLNSSK